MKTRSQSGATALAKIDGRIRDNVDSSLEQVQLRIERNALTPTIRLLPVEVLTEIFHFLQTPFDDLDDHCLYQRLAEEFDEISPETWETWDWSAVTHVCHYWRKAALECPSLWAMINSSSHTSSTQTRTYVERSKSALLSVRHMENTMLIWRRPLALVDCLLEVLRELPRTRELRIQLDTNNRMPDIIALLKQPAPVLQRFDLIWPEMHSDSSAYMDTLRSLFHNGEAPQLRYLSLQVTRFPFESTLLKNLQTLILRDITTPLALSNLLGILLACPQMGDLRVSGCRVEEGVHAGVDVISQDYPVNLTSLHCLELFSISSASYETFYRHTRIPKDASWSYSLYDHQFQQMKPLIPSIINRQIPCDHLIVTLGQSELRIEDAIVDDDNGDKFASMRLEWSTLTSSIHIFELASQCLARGQFWCHATILEVNLMEDIIWSYLSQDGLNENDTCWISILRLMPNLQVLRVIFTPEPVESEMITVVDQIVLMRTLRNHCRQSENVLCPQLRKLTIESALFKPITDESFFLELQSCLQARHERGYPIKQLEIIDGYEITREMVETLELEGYIEQVVWDGMSNAYEIDLGIYDSGTEDGDFTIFAI